jgi:hypothetical protein
LSSVSAGFTSGTTRHEPPGLTPRLVGGELEGAELEVDVRPVEHADLLPASGDVAGKRERQCVLERKRREQARELSRRRDPVARRGIHGGKTDQRSGVARGHLAILSPPVEGPDRVDDRADARARQSVRREVVDELLDVGPAHVAEASAGEPVRDVAQSGLEVLDGALAIATAPLVECHTGPGGLYVLVARVVEPGRGDRGRRKLSLAKRVGELLAGVARLAGAREATRLAVLVSGAVPDDAEVARRAVTRLRIPCRSRPTRLLMTGEDPLVARLGVATAHRRHLHAAVPSRQACSSTQRSRSLSG